MPTPNSSRSIILDMIAARLGRNGYSASRSIDEYDAWLEAGNPDSGFFYVSVGEDKDNAREYSSYQIRDMLIDVQMIYVGAHDLEARIEDMLKLLRDTLMADPYLRTTKTDANSGNCIMIHEVMVDSIKFYDGAVGLTSKWNVKYQYTVGNS